MALAELARLVPAYYVTLNEEPAALADSLEKEATRKETPP